MVSKAKHYAGWICAGFLACALVGVLIYVFAQRETNERADQASDYTKLVQCAIYYNELESYGEQRPAPTEENWYNVIWEHLEPYRKQYISTNERYVWGDYNEQRAYLLLFLKHYYDECLRDKE